MAEADANARLMAAAPDLLEACREQERLLNTLAQELAKRGLFASDVLPGFQGAGTRVVAAIKKATNF